MSCLQPETLNCLQCINNCRLYLNRAAHAPVHCIDCANLSCGYASIGTVTHCINTPKTSQRPTTERNKPLGVGAPGVEVSGVSKVMQACNRPSGCVRL